MNVIAYVRISTSQQTCLNQEYEIAEYCKANHIHITKWVCEVISSRKSLKERELSQVLSKLKKKDKIIATELSRLGRSMLEVMNILRYCLERDCEIITIKENYHLGGDIESKVLAFAFSLASEIERELISQRTKESLVRLKSQGVRLGRPKGRGIHKLDNHYEEIQQLLSTGCSKSQLAKKYHCTWATMHNYINTCIYLKFPISRKVMRVKELSFIQMTEHLYSYHNFNETRENYVDLTNVNNDIPF